MFRNLIVYRLEAWTPESLEAVEERMGLTAFAECGPTQPQSSGWVPPRGEKGGALVEHVGNQMLMRLQVERKAVPGATLKRILDQRLDVIEAVTGRRPKGKLAKELKEEIAQELLPRAFAKRSSTMLWLDLTARLLLIEAASLTAADYAVSAAVEMLGGGVRLSLLQTATAPATAMAHWLVSQEAPEGFTVDRETELKQPDSQKAAVRYSRHTLDIAEVAEHVRQGKLPTRLAMTWNSRVSFVLTDTLAIRSIKLLDVVLEGRADEPDADAFDADVAISTGELRTLIADLVPALGGELVRSPPASNAQPAPAAVAPHTGEGPDPLIDQACSLVMEHRRASISLVQRYLRIGYNRASRLLDVLEQRGVISPVRSDGTRQILEAA